jgi:hypothetical protein
MDEEINLVPHTPQIVSPQFYLGTVQRRNASIIML